MDYSRHARDLEQALRFGRAPVEEVQSAAKKGYEDGVVDPNNLSDAVLADYLGEHDDPRETIVRRDLEHRRDLDANGKAKPYHLAHGDYLHQTLGLTPQQNHYDYHQSTFERPVEGGRMQVHHYHNPANGKHAYDVYWRPAQGYESRTNDYQSVLHPHEYEKVAEEFGLHVPHNLAPFASEKPH